VTEIASTRKITYHAEKLQAYLRGEPIFPATLELDLTSVCNRRCANCPSTTTLPAYSLSTDFVSRLFARLEGQTRGLLLTGGEPTLAHNFAETLALARTRGFRDVVVVTNGSFLGEEKIAQALLKHASAIRISLYDWNAKSCSGMAPTLKRIETLRSRIEREGSSLQIGVSALTSHENVAALNIVARAVASAGAHWVYFHPTCTKWELGTPVLMDQQGVLEQTTACRRAQTDGFRAFVFSERYTSGEIEFEGYHTSHFLLVVGADGMNYLGAEVKYQPAHIIADVAGDWRDDFLWQSERLERIRAVNSRTFPAIGSRHRGILYNNLIEQMRQTDALPVTQDTFLFPHIL
jgi:GTP 3',8-cyclase